MVSLCDKRKVQLKLGVFIDPTGDHYLSQLTGSQKNPRFAALRTCNLPGTTVEDMGDTRVEEMARVGSV